MEIIRIRREARLDGPIIPESLGGTLCGGESQAHQFVIRATRGGLPVTLSGTVTGECIRWEDNRTVALTGRIENGAAVVTLAAACYALEGQIRLTIYVSDGEAVMAVYTCNANVRRTGTEEQVDPGTVMPSFTQMITQMESVRASIPADYSALSAQVDEMGENVGDDLYEHETDTDAYYWRPNTRVNNYATYSINQDHYTAMYKNSARDQVYVRPGTKITANAGYKMDYGVKSESGETLELQRDVAEGTTITIRHYGYLRLSVTDVDGTADTSTAAKSAPFAKAALTIDMVEYPIKDTVLQNEADIAKLQAQAAGTGVSDLVKTQKAIAADWRFAYIDVSGGMGLGSAHLIPGTATTWKATGTDDLDQKGVWMSDGIHPHLGATGIMSMYARTITPQLLRVAPDYRSGEGQTSPSIWAGRTIMWLGTSIPAGSGGSNQYPAQVCALLGAESINKAQGGSCVRINASTGNYDGMRFLHFCRALSRTEAECDLLAANWASIKDKISLVDSEASESLDGYVELMKNHSFERVLLPYLRGDDSKPMPDLFVLDHGHNDVRPLGVDGKNDLWLEPSLQAIQDGILAEDTYMTANNYANLKSAHALNNDLSGISDKAAFAATLNRNCFRGAMNFIITLILSYNAHARIVIVGDYN